VAYFKPGTNCGPLLSGAEELKRHINAYFSQLLAVVEKHQGDVIKFAGDAIIVLWANNKDRDYGSYLRKGKTKNQTSPRRSPGKKSTMNDSGEHLSRLTAVAVSNPAQTLLWLGYNVKKSG
jgi:class 3 adenylate cyclase